MVRHPQKMKKAHARIVFCSNLQELANVRDATESLHAYHGPVEP